jgi:hypothetical protein
MTENLDILAMKFNLFYRKRDKFPTIIGAFLSLTLMLSFGICFILFGLDLVQKKKPDVMTNEVFIPDPLANLSEFTFLMKPFDIGLNSTTEVARKFSFNLLYIDLNESRINQTQEYIFVPMVTCDTTQLILTNRDNITSYLMGTPSEYYCIPDSFQGELYGKHGTNNHKMINFLIRYIFSY